MDDHNSAGCLVMFLFIVALILLLFCVARVEGCEKKDGFATSVPTESSLY